MDGIPFFSEIPDKPALVCDEEEKMCCCEQFKMGAGESADTIGTAHVPSNFKEKSRAESWQRGGVAGGRRRVVEASERSASEMSAGERSAGVIIAKEGSGMTRGPPPDEGRGNDAALLCPENS